MSVRIKYLEKGTAANQIPITAAGTFSLGYQDLATVIAPYIEGLNPKQAARAATTANITLSGLQTIDGVALADGERVLVKNQTNGAENGIYTASAGAWTRSTDANTNAEVTANMYLFVAEGTTNADIGYLLTTNNPITLGVTSLTFVPFSSSSTILAGNYLTKTGNTLDVNIGEGLESGGSNNIRVKIKDVTIRRDAAGISATVPQNQTDLVGAVTTADGQLATATTLAKTPFGSISVLIGGSVRPRIGDGVKTTPCYFSADGGATARTLANIVAGDSLYWNGSIAGFQLDAVDRIHLIYNSYL